MKRILLWVLAALLAVVVIAGCSGISSLSGGSVPIGGVDGRVFVRNTTLEPVAAITVELVRPNGDTEQAVTDDTGHFSFSKLPKGRTSLQVTDSTGASAELDVDLDEEANQAEVALLLAPDVVGSAQVTLAPTTVEVSVGGVVPFTAGVLDANNQPLSIPVSWAVEGRIGEITPTGVFTATRIGAGRVKAQYKHLQATARVTVTSATETKP